MTGNQKKLPLYIYFALAGHISSYCWLPQRGGMWGRENDYEVVNQRQSFLKTLIHTDNFLTFVRFRKLRNLLIC